MFRRYSLAIPYVSVFLALMLIAGGITCARAASKPAKKSSSAAPAPAAAVKFTKETDCSICHAAYTASVKDDKMLLSRHANITRDCFSCHREEDMTRAHENVTKAPGKLFRQRKYPDDLCVKCHGGYDQLAEKTKNSKVFVALDGKVMNPHDTHKGRVECFNCHKMHKDRPPIEYCYGCHHGRQLNNCKDCHSKK